MGLDLTLVLLTGRLRSLNLPRRSRLVSPIYCRLQRLHFKVFRYSFFRRHTDVFQSPYKWFFLVRYAIMAFGNGNGKVPANNIPGSLGCSRRPDRLGIPRHSFLPRFCWIVAIMKTSNKVAASWMVGDKSPEKWGKSKAPFLLCQRVSRSYFRDGKPLPLTNLMYFQN